MREETSIDKPFSKDELDAISSRWIVREHLRRPLLYMVIPWFVIAFICMLTYNPCPGDCITPLEWVQVGLIGVGALLWTTLMGLVIKRHRRTGQYDVDLARVTPKDLEQIVGHRMSSHFNRYFWRLFVPWSVVGLLAIYLPVEIGYLYSWEARAMVWLFLTGWMTLILFGAYMARKMNRVEREEIHSAYDTWRSCILGH